ncbi:MAG: AAA family ATPase [Bacteroidaceae bacterium]
MSELASYIKRIEIKGLWGRKDIIWNLRPDVNILSGINGIGKSSILDASVYALSASANGKKELSRVIGNVQLFFEPEKADSVRFDVIRSFDRPFIQADSLTKIMDCTIRTELDWQLYKLQRDYLDYQVNIGNRMIEMLSSEEDGDKIKAALLSGPKRLFQNMVDKLFVDTEKKIDRRSNELRFKQDNKVLSPYQLSSGEKQLLVILLTVLVQDNAPCVLFMDEPEVSLHIEWQQQLISIIRKLNAHVQIILTTHSPAMMMDGWMDAVTEVSDISKSYKL